MDDKTRIGSEITIRRFPRPDNWAAVIRVSSNDDCAEAYLTTVELRTLYDWCKNYFEEAK